MAGHTAYPPFGVCNTTDYVVVVGGQQEDGAAKVVLIFLLLVGLALVNDHGRGDGLIEIAGGHGHRRNPFLEEWRKEGERTGDRIILGWHIALVTKHIGTLLPYRTFSII